MASITDIVAQKKNDAITKLYNQSQGIAPEPTPEEQAQQQYLLQYQAQLDAELLQKLAIAYWGRALTPAELDQGLALLAVNGHQPGPIIDYLAQSAEFLGRFHGLDLQSAITSAYQLTFARTPSASDLGWWLDQIEHGYSPVRIPAWLALNASGGDAAVLANKAVAAQQMTAAYETVLTKAFNANELAWTQGMRQLLSGVSATDDLSSISNALQKLAAGDTSVLTPSASLPNAPLVILYPFDDDGPSYSDNMTSKSLVRLNISGLDPQRQLAWVDLDGNGQFDLAADIAVPPTPLGFSQITVPLKSGVNGFQVYQTVNGVTSPPGTISIYRLQDTDVVTPGKNIAYAGSTISLELDRVIDWRVLDTNGDGRLQVRNLNDPNDTGELQIAWGSSGTNRPMLDNAQLSAAQISIPPYGSRFLTITGVTITAANPAAELDGELTLILVGVPDVQGGVNSNVVFTI